MLIPKLGRTLGVTVMPLPKLPTVGDRVNVEGREGVFFVLKCDGDARVVSLLSSHNNGPLLDDIPVDALTILSPPPGSKGPTTTA
jgi:hypothetical protein